MTTTDLAVPTNGVNRRETRYSVMPMVARVAYADQLSNAEDLIPSGLFSKQTGRPSPAKIFLVMEIGAMLGLEPLAAIQGIDVIEGKAAISPQLMTGIIRAAGHKLRIVETGSIKGGDFEVTVTLIRSDDPDEPISASWSLEDAVAAELIQLVYNAETQTYSVKAESDRGKALAWQKYTRDMCLWRALGRLGRRGANDILNGIAYMPEELAAIVGEDGTRESAIDTEAEADWIIKIKALDDKQDMRDLFREINEAEGWTPRLSAEFDSHLSTLTKDSRAAQQGAPGNTGIPAIDGPKETPPTATEPPESRDETPPEVETPAPGVPEGVTEAPSAAPEPLEVQRDADGLIPPGEALRAARARERRTGEFNASALGQ